MECLRLCIARRNCRGSVFVARSFSGRIQAHGNLCVRGVGNAMAVPTPRTQRFPWAWIRPENDRATNTLPRQFRRAMQSRKHSIDLGGTACFPGNEAIHDVKEIDRMDSAPNPMSWPT